MAPVTRILLTAFAVITLLVGTGVYLSVRGDDTATTQSDSGPPGQLVRDNSHRLGEASREAVTLVEFLDFECEACRAAFPMVERLRSEMSRVLNAPETRNKLAEMGMQTLNLGPREFQDFLQQEIRKWGPVIKAAQIKAE